MPTMKTNTLVTGIIVGGALGALAGLLKGGLALGAVQGAAAGVAAIVAYQSLGEQPEKTPRLSPRKRLDRGVRLVSNERCVCTKESQSVGRLSQNGFQIKFPENSVDKEYPLEVKCCVPDSNKIPIPKNTVAVGGVFYVDAKFELLKPAKLLFEHCCNIENKSDLSFIKVLGMNSPFKEVEGVTVFDKHVEIEAKKFHAAYAIVAEKNEVKLRYNGLVYREAKGLKKANFHFIIVSKGLRAEEVDRTYHKKMGIEQLHFEEVEFCNEGGEISLDIPKEGISVDGWKIVPAVYPLKISQRDAGEQSENHPTCILEAQWTGSASQVEELSYQVQLRGNKDLKSFNISSPALSITPKLAVFEQKIDTIVEILSSPAMDINFFGTQLQADELLEQSSLDTILENESSSEKAKELMISVREKVREDPKNLLPVLIDVLDDNDPLQSVAKAISGADDSSAGKGHSGGDLMVAFSFDTTGSMYDCLDEVRSDIAKSVKELKKSLPDIRIAIIAHGDYCDAKVYVTKIKDFSTDEEALCEFVENVERTGGGDCDECYERVLYDARKSLSWKAGTQRVLVLIGDANPHEVGYRYGGTTYELDWRKEAKLLYDKLRVKIYSVQALDNSDGEFYEEIAHLTKGKHLKLEQFSDIVTLMEGISHKARGRGHFQHYVHQQNLNTEKVGFLQTLNEVSDSIDDCPVMNELTMFRGVEDKFNITRRIGSKSSEFGKSLLGEENEADVQSIIAKRRGDENSQILQMWLDGKGREPVTWGTLIEVLQEVGLEDLAHDIEAAVKS